MSIHYANSTQTLRKPRFKIIGNLGLDCLTSKQLQATDSIQSEYQLDVRLIHGC